MEHTDKNPAAIHWGQLVKRYRKAKGWNQTQLAQKVGTVQQVVSAWEQHRYPPNPVHQARLVHTLDIDPIELHQLLGKFSDVPESVA